MKFLFLISGVIPFLLSGQSHFDLPVSTFLSEHPAINNTVYFENGDYAIGEMTPRKHYIDFSQILVEYVEEEGQSVRYSYLYRDGIQYVETRSEYIHKIRANKIMQRPRKGKKGVISTIEGLWDVPNGLYEEFVFDAEIYDTRIKSRGQCKEGVRVGKWIFFPIRNHKIVAVYNEEGQLDGPYQEFYNEVLIIEGQFGQRDIEHKNISALDDKGQPFVFTKSYSRRIGEWKFYSPSGDLLETAEYKWIPQ